MLVSIPLSEVKFLHLCFTVRQAVLSLRDVTCITHGVTWPLQHPAKTHFPLFHRFQTDHLHDLDNFEG